MGRLTRRAAVGNLIEQQRGNGTTDDSPRNLAHRSPTPSPLASALLDKFSHRRHGWTNPFKRPSLSPSEADGRSNQPRNTSRSPPPLSPHAKRPFVQSRESLIEVTAVKSPRCVPIMTKKTALKDDLDDVDYVRPTRHSVHFEANVEVEALSICNSPESAYVNHAFQSTKSAKRRSTRSTKSSRSSRSTSTFGRDSGYGSFFAPSTDNLHKRASARSNLSSASGIDSTCGSPYIPPLDLMPRRRNTANSGIMLDDIDSLHDQEDQSAGHSSVRHAGSGLNTPYHEDFNEPFFPLDSTEAHESSQLDATGNLSAELTLTFPVKSRTPSDTSMASDLIAPVIESLKTTAAACVTTPNAAEQDGSPAGKDRVVASSSDPKSSHKTASSISRGSNRPTKPTRLITEHSTCGSPQIASPLECENTDDTDNEDYSGDEYSDSCASQSWSPTSASGGAIQASISPLRAQWIERAMAEVRALFAQDPLLVSCMSGSHTSAGRTSVNGVHTPGSGESSTAGRRRKARDEDDWAPPDDDDNDQMKRRKPNDDPTKKRPEDKLACPFFKHDPASHQTFRSCAGPGWDTIHRVKEHIYRRHMLPVQCPRCRTHFDNDDALVEHQRSDERCPLRSEDEVEPIDGIDKTQEKLLRSRKRVPGQNDEDKWRDVYRIVFPTVDSADIPSPHYEATDLPAPLSPDADRFRRQEQLNRRRLLRLVRTRLERMVETEVLDSVLDIVRDCQDEIARSHHDRSSPSAAPLETAGAAPPAGDVQPPQLLPPDDNAFTATQALDYTTDQQFNQAFTFANPPYFADQALDFPQAKSKPPSDSAYGSNRAESFNTTTRPYVPALAGIVQAPLDPGQAGMPTMDPSYFQVPPHQNVFANVSAAENPLVALPTYPLPAPDYNFAFTTPHQITYFTASNNTSPHHAFDPNALQHTTWSECAVADDESVNFYPSQSRALGGTAQDGQPRSLYTMQNVDIGNLDFGAELRVGKGKGKERVDNDQGLGVFG